MDRWSRRQVVQGVGVAGLGLLAGCGRLPWQAAPVKVPKIGFLSPGTRESLASLTDHFLAGLSEHGYIDGQNIALEYRFADDRLDQLPRLAAELVRVPVDIIVGYSTVIPAAKNATSTIPIVMATSGDPVRTGLVASLARPGGNVTGLTIISEELSGKRLELLKEVVPRVARVAVLWNADHPDKALEFAETQTAAQVLGVQLQSLAVRQPGDLPDAFEAATREHADALLVLGESLTVGHRTEIVDWASKRRLPATYEVADFVTVGGLMAYGPNLADMMRRSAVYVDKILKGAKPADLPVERPLRFDFVINLRTAQALGLTIPAHVLLQATEVIQ